MKHTCLLVVLVLTSGSTFAGQQNPDKPALIKQYQSLIDALNDWLPKEIEDKGIPALSIAIVDDQTTVWSAGFGMQDARTKTAAGPRTVYRVGSVSKPVTALLLMMLVEAGLLDLDAPVQR